DRPGDRNRPRAAPRPAGTTVAVHTARRGPGGHRRGGPRLEQCPRRTDLPGCGGDPAMRGLVGPLLKGLAFVLVTTVATVLLAVSISNVRMAQRIRYAARFTDVTSLN